MVTDRNMTPAPFPALPKSAKSTFTLEEKRELIELLLATWAEAPDLRLGQLLTAATVREGLLFGLDDLALYKCVAEFRERVSNK